MPRILHLTDTHLAPTENDDALGDYKEGFVPLADRQLRVAALRAALREFAEEHPEPLDLLVMSGDITVAGARAGFELFADVLSDLGSALPDPSRIIVVPGNHDVAWMQDSGTRARYELFLEFVRTAGFVTPRLEGIDIRADGNALPGAVESVVVSPDKTVVVLALNSSNYSGILEPSDLEDAQWAGALGTLGADDVETAKKELRSLRLRDAARVSPAQLTAERELRRVRNELRTAGHDPKRIVTVAVLHHQLLPVSVDEELKTFESLSNLAQVREFLRANEIDVVLHGHKHAAAVYWDTIPRLGKDLDDAPARVLVISGGALGTRGYNGDAFRTVDIDTSAPLTRVVVTSYRGVPEGAQIQSDAVANTVLDSRATVAADGVARVAPIVGATVTDVYRRALTELGRSAGSGGYVANLVCEIRDPGSPLRLPDGYPAIPNVADADRDNWLKDLVLWWQRPDPTLGPNLGFNHGGRIHAYRGRDQLEAAELALRNAPDSSRALLVLVDPTTDIVEQRQLKFPAFCLVQFVIRSAVDSPRRLDCAAYFRKQEIRWWWPINVAELASMQTSLCESLQDTYDDLVPGTILTVAAIAKAGNTVPRVAVPPLDRLFEDEPTDIALLAVAACVPAFPGRAALLVRFDAVLDGLIPPQQRDPDGVPVAIEGLSQLVTALQHVDTDGSANTLRQALQRVLTENRLYVEKMDDRRAHANWRRQATEAIDEARTALERLREN